MSEFIPDLVKEATAEFTNHLNLENNNRLIFSGRYGLGKTQFLKEYFKQKEEDYYTVSLAPVNYSVASNDDVFTYIKYDILQTLITDEKLVLKDLDFTKWETLPFFFNKHRKDIVKSILRCVSKLGSIKDYGLSRVYKELDGLYDKLEAFQDKSNHGDKKDLDSFFDLLNEQEGSLYEHNIITKLITEGLGKVEQPTNVLIIDDLDRIDPEHIFRLFNIFGAHIDFKGDEGDKFGFDKVIFVCDIENIRSIFHHRYGTRTDFSGYIDKFYSIRVFYFDNKNDLKRILMKYIDNIDFPNSRANWREGAKNKVADELFFIIDRFRINGAYNLRNLFNKSQNHGVIDKKIFLQNNSERHFMSLVSAVVIQILLTIYGDKETLKKHLEKSHDKNETWSQFVSGNLNNAMLLNFIEEHRLTDGSTIIDKYGIKFEIKIDTHYNSGIKHATLQNEQKFRGNLAMFTEEFKENMNLFRMYQNCIDMLERKGIM